MLKKGALRVSQFLHPVPTFIFVACLPDMGTPSGSSLASPGRSSLRREVAPHVIAHRFMSLMNILLCVESNPYQATLVISSCRRVENRANPTTRCIGSKLGRRWCLSSNMVSGASSSSRVGRRSRFFALPVSVLCKVTRTAQSCHSHKLSTLQRSFPETDIGTGAQ